MHTRSRSRFLTIHHWPIVVSLLPIVCFATDTARADETDPQAGDPKQVFEERIMPIFRSEKPSSCVQCHLASIDIKDYILPSHRKTFLALREQGLINLEKPRQSKILQLIQMGEDDPDALARRIHERVRKSEYEAFAAWIEACCADPTLSGDTAVDKLPSVGPDEPLEVIRHSRKSRLADSFTRNIWSQRMRCFPCHTPHEIERGNPKHAKAAERHREMVKQYGAKMNLFAATPEATMQQMIANSRSSRGDNYPLLNLSEPSKSLLVLKPTSKLPPKKEDGNFEKPSSAEPVSHMGGLKMHRHDASYKSFLAWINDYAAISEGRYVNVEDLPADNWVPTQRVLRVNPVPASWKPGTVVQLMVHSADGDRPTEQPVAFTQGTVTPRKIVNGTLFLFRDHAISGDISTSLPPGRYWVKAYVDRTHQLEKDPTLLLGQEAYAGQANIEAQWETGWPNAEVVTAEAFEAASGR